MLGRMNQVTFNRMFTILYSLFFMSVFLYSVITHWVIPWESIIGFVVPTVNHIVHQINLTKLETTTINADVTKSVSADAKGSNHLEHS